MADRTRVLRSGCKTSAGSSLSTTVRGGQPAVQWVSSPPQPSPGKLSQTPPPHTSADQWLTASSGGFSTELKVAVTPPGPVQFLALSPGCFFQILQCLLWSPSFVGWGDFREGDAPGKGRACNQAPLGGEGRWERVFVGEEPFTWLTRATSPAQSFLEGRASPCAAHSPHAAPVMLAVGTRVQRACDAVLASWNGFL